MTDAELRVISDADVLALTLFGEARGDGRDGSSIEERIAVGCVIRNRLHSGRFGIGYRGVCLKPLQFSCWNDDGSTNHAAVVAAMRSLTQRNTIAPLLRECLWIADGLIDGAVIDTTHGATHYLTRALFESAPPSWAKGQPVRATIGSHVFLEVA